MSLSTEFCFRAPATVDVSGSRKYMLWQHWHCENRKIIPSKGTKYGKYDIVFFLRQNANTSFRRDWVLLLSHDYYVVMTTDGFRELFSEQYACILFIDNSLSWQPRSRRLCHSTPSCSWTTCVRTVTTANSLQVDLQVDFVRKMPMPTKKFDDIFRPVDTMHRRRTTTTTTVWRQCTENLSVFTDGPIGPSVNKLNRQQMREKRGIRFPLTPFTVLSAMPMHL